MSCLSTKPTTIMKLGNHILPLILLAFAACVPQRAAAQFFDFGFGDNPFMQQRPQQKREPYVQPRFKGDKDGINKFIRKHYQNPAGETHKEEGRIVVACIINEKGRVVETHVVRSVAPAFDKEAQRVCTKMKFKPAMSGKKKVKSRMDIVFPIRRGRLSFNTLPTVDV